MSFFESIVDWMFGYDFFISYKWSDGRLYAKSLRDKLKKYNFRCFLDSEDYRKGDNWKATGRRALKKSSILILVGTPEAPKSKPILEELDFFLSVTKRHLIPIDINNTLANLISDHELKKYLPEDKLSIPETKSTLKLGPDKVTVAAIKATEGLVKQETKRLRLVTAVSCLILLLAIGMAAGWVYSNIQKNYAEENRKTATSRMLALRADQQKNKSMDLSLLLGIQALNTADTSDARGILLDILNTGIKQVLRGHNHCVNDLNFHSDKNILASISADDKVFIWRFDGNRYIPEIQHIPSHQMPSPEELDTGTNRVKFLLNENKLLIKFSNSDLYCWNWKQKKVVWRHLSDAAAIGYCKITQANNKIEIIAVTSDSKPELFFLDPYTGKQILSSINLPKPLQNHRALSISTKGLVAMGFSEEILIWNIDLPTQKPYRLKRHTAYVTALSFLPNGELASGGEDNIVFLWKFDEKNNLWKCEDMPLIRHQATISALAFSPEDHLLLAGSATHPNGVLDNRISIRKLNHMEYPTIFRTGHEQPVSSIDIAPGGKIVASTSWDGTIMIWNGDFYRDGAKPIQPDDTIMSCSSNSGEYQAVLCKDKIVLKNLRTGKTANVAANENTKYIAFDNKAALLYKVGPQLVTNSTSNPNKLALKTEKVFDISIHNAEVPETYDLFKGIVCAAVNTEKGEIHVRSLKLDSKVIDKMESEIPSMWSQKSFHDREMYFKRSSSTLKEAEEYTIDNQGKLFAFSRYSQDDDEDSSHDVFIWDLGKKEAPLKIMSDIQYGVGHMNFSPYSRFLLVTSNDRLIKIWDHKRKKIVGENSNSVRNFVNYSSFSNNSCLLAVIDTHGQTVKLLSSPDLSSIGDLPLFDPTAIHGIINSMAFSIDDQQLLVNTSSGIMNLGIGKVFLKANIKRIVGRNLSNTEWNDHIKIQPYEKIFTDLPIPSVPMHLEYVAYDFQM